MYTCNDSLFDTPETKTTWLINYPLAKIKKKKIQVSYLTVLTCLTGLKSRCPRGWFLSRGEDLLFCLSQLLEAARIPWLVVPFFCLQRLIHVTSLCPIFQGRASFLP